MVKGSFPKAYWQWRRDDPKNNTLSMTDFRDQVYNKIDKKDLESEKQNV